MTETFTYGLFNRPAMYGTVPAGFTNEQSHKDFAYGTIDYSHRLTDEEIYRYELARVSPNTFDLPIGATVERLDAGESGYTSTRYYRGRYILTHKATGDEEYSVKVSDVREITVPIAVEPVKAPAMVCPECGSTCKSLKTYEDSTWGITHTYKCMSCGLKFDQSFPDAMPEAVDAHGNALCERCHRNHIFYADSERFCQPCLLAIESEYDAKIAREEAQSLYNSNSGVDAEDYRAHMDAFAPELVSEATPAPFAVGDYVFVVTDNGKIIRGHIEVLENVWYDVRTDLGALFIANVNATFRTFIEAKIYRSQRDGVSETPTDGETAMLTPDDIIALAIDDIRDQRRPANPARFADNVQSAIDSIRAENKALKQRLAAAQKALVAIVSIKYDDMQAIRDRAETGLIESDYYVASLK